MSEPIAETYGNLYVHINPDSPPKEHGKVKIEIARLEGFEYTLTLIKEGKTLYCQVIEDSMCISFQSDALEWIVYRADGAAPSRMRIVFTEEDFKDVILAIARALIESTMGKSIENCYEEEDRDWAVKSQVQDMRDDTADEFVDFVDEKAVPARMSDSEDEEFQDIEDEESTEGVPEPLFKERKRTVPGGEVGNIPDFAHSKNSHMVSGFNLNRTFVSRGNDLGVFGYNSNDELEYVTRLNQIKRLDGTTISNPRKIQLHDADTRLLFLDDENPNKLYNMDLETGRIIDEYTGPSSYDIKNIAPRTKYAQTTNESLVVGVNDYAVFSLDPRIGESNKLAEDMSYKTKTGFTSAATTGEGMLAVASETGDIRLSNKIQKNYCKTLLPGLGAPITHIEVTEDSTWLVATSKKCLIVFDLTISGGKLEGKSGFTGRMGQYKPTPLVLKISASDMMRYNIQNVDFKPARFNTGTVANTKEEYITTSTGNLVITWDFNKVKKGILSAYKIKETDANIVEDFFRHNFKEQLAVAQNDQVFSARLNPHAKRY